MNYYIQGNKDNAGQIKAAFKELGYNTRGLNFSCGFFYTVERDVHYCVRIYDYMVNIIKTHPDYQELELPVEPKFKVGDWIACDADSFTLSIKSVRDVNYYFHQGGSLPIKDIDEHYHLWSIADAKDGDIIGFNDCTHNDGSYIDWVGIYKEKADAEKSHFFHCVITSKKDFRISILSWRVFTAYHATKEQRDLLFQKIKEAGYQWDADKKELKKIKPHYDISNFNPFDRVLVRYDDSCTWGVSFFGRFDGMFMCCSNICFTQCIPFEGNEHLLGTTDMPDEMYINW